jgi:hypothetical protein
MRRFLSSIWFIHGLVLLGLFALFGVISTHNPLILLGVAASFSGAVCGAFIRVIDAIKNARSRADS